MIPYWQSDRLVSLVLPLAFAFNVAGIGHSQTVGQDAVELPIEESSSVEKALSGVTIVVPKWSHLNLNLEHASELEALSLARGYLELKYALNYAKLARSGATIVTDAIADVEKIGSSNADDCIRILKTRLSGYGREIEKRGYSTLSDAYLITINGGSDPTLVEQSEFEFTWSAGTELHTGVIVEKALAIENATNPEVTFVGKLSDRTVRLTIESVGIASTLPGSDEFEMTWTENDGAGKVFAMAYLGRALAKQDREEFAAAMMDLDETLSRDPDLTTALATRSQLRSMCPLAKYRNGDRAMVDAERYCEIYSKRGSENWTCHALRAAAHAQKGEFTQAVEFAKQAEELAPPEVREQMRVRFQAYESGRAIYLGLKQ